MVDCVPNFRRIFSHRHQLREVAVVIDLVLIKTKELPKIDNQGNILKNFDSE